MGKDRLKCAAFKRWRQNEAWECCDPEPRDGCIAQRLAIVGPEEARRLDRLPASTDPEAPLLFRTGAAVSQAAMLQEVARRSRAAMSGEIIGARGEQRADRGELP